MAKIVLGLGSAHSPMLSLGGERWAEYGDRDKMNPMLTAVPGGEVMTYEELLSQADPSIAKGLTPEKLQAQHDVCQKAIATLEKTLKDANPDVVVIVGDDQEEMFFDDNMPLFSVYWGESMRLIPRHTGESAPQIVRDSAWGYGDVEMDVPVDAELGLHLIHQLVEADFDVGHIRYQKEEYGGAVGPSGYINYNHVTASKRQGMPHAFAFVVKRLMNGNTKPIVPIFQNTFYPPNQPTPRRCYAFGRAIAQAIKAWDSDKRVAVVASGGLSHFTVDEEVDWMTLNGIRNKDVDALCSLPRHRLNAGTSENLNWVTAAGALEDLDMEVVGYEPVYRSPAGTGGGWGFARWQ